jgi:membrane protein implicated in regulation of membrane protease activity
MGEIPIQLIASLPVAAALIYVVKMFLTTQKEWREDLKSVTDSTKADLRSITDATHEVIERNTEALLKIEGTLSNCRANGRTT